MIKYIFIISTILLATHLNSQSLFGFYSNRQSEIDSFKIITNNTDSLSSLSFGENINNIDSLENLKYVEYFSIQGLQSITSYHGLRNVKKIYSIYNVLNPRDTLTLPFLDTITTFLVWNQLFNDQKLKPSLIKHVKHISGWFIVSENVDLSVIPYYTHTKDLSISFRRKRNHDLTDLKKNDFDRIAKLDFRDCKFVETKGIQKLDTVSLLFLRSNENCKFNELTLVKSLEEFDLEKNLSGNDFGGGFQITTLHKLKFRDCIDVPDFKTLFPKLTSIKNKIQITNNKNLETLLPLNNISLNSSFGDSIIIKNNVSLINCNVDFLCQALELFPDRVVIDGNGSGCSLEEIKSYCKIVSTNNLYSNSNILIYPNPTTDKLFVQTTENVDFHYTIFDTQSNAVRQGKTNNKIIDLKYLNAGSYVLQLKSNLSSQVSNHKFITIK